MPIKIFLVHLEQIELLAEELERLGWQGQATWLKLEAAFARRELGFLEREPSWDLDFTTREGWGPNWRLAPDEVLPERPLSSVPPSLASTLWQTAAVVADAGGQVASHRLRTLGKYLTAASDRRGNIPWLDHAPGTLHQLLLKATVQGYPFEAAALHLAYEADPHGLIQGTAPTRSVEFVGPEVQSWIYDSMPWRNFAKSRISYDLPVDIEGDSATTPRVRGVSTESRKFSDFREGDAPPTDNARFLFRLKGQAWRDLVRLGGDFELCFVFAVSGVDDLVTLEASAFEEARRESLSFDLTVHAPGFTFRDGVFAQPVHFLDGELKEPVSFALQAPTSWPESAVTLWVQASRGGRTFYQIPLRLHLVQALTEDLEPRPPVHIDLDALAVACKPERQGRKATLTITAEPQLWFHLAIDGRPKLQAPLTKYGLMELNTHLESLVTTVQPGVEHRVWNDLFFEEHDGEWTPDLSQNLHENEAANDGLQRLAGAGHALWEFLCKDPQMNDCLEAIDQLADGSRLEIFSNRIFLPWELLNPHPFHYEWSVEDRRQFPAQAQRFWGFRFLIEANTLQMTTLGEGPPSGGEGPPYLSLHINSSIDDEATNVEVRPAAAHQKIFAGLEAGILKEYLDDGLEMCGKLTTPQPWTLVYLFCHGEQVRSNQAWSVERLRLDETTDLQPKTLAVPRPPYTHRPIVILNSCSSGAFSPLRFDSFLTEFKKRGACGLIATHFPVPTHFASAFGQRLLAEYAAGETGIGEIIHRLRGELLKRGNPLGLLYAVQCPLEAKAPPASKVEDKFESERKLA